MVNKRDTQEQSGLQNLGRQQAVWLAGLNIAARVIVDDQRAGHRLTQERAEDVSGTDVDPIHLTEGRDVSTANAIFRIQAKDMHRLLLGLA